MDWDRIVKWVHRCKKWMKQAVGLIVTTTVLVFLCEPFLTAMSVTFRSTFLDVNSPVTDEERAIEDPLITGTEAVRRFRSHLQCFSDSGKWVYDPTPRHLPWNYIGDSYASTCDGNHLAGGDSSHVGYDSAEDIALRGIPGNWSVREELKWVWRTNSSCPWRAYDRDDFCRQTGSKGNIMLVGDSLNHQISWSFMNNLIINGTGYERLGPYTRSIIEPFEMCDDILGQGKGFNVSFVRNDRLSPLVDASVDTWSNFYELPWVDLLGELGIKTLLLNRGAHYEDDEKYTTSLHNIFTFLSLRHPHIHVIYRNTQPGHLDCMNFTRPLSEVQHDGFRPGYHWEDFNRQNLLAKQIVEDYHYTYMDVYSLLSLRADGHIGPADCLHYCLPGPLDIVVEYLYNIFLLLN